MLKCHGEQENQMNQYSEKQSEHDRSLCPFTHLSHGKSEVSKALLNIYIRKIDALFKMGRKIREKLDRCTIQDGKEDKEEVR